MAQPASSSGSGADQDPRNAWLQMGYDSMNWYFNPVETAFTKDNASQLTEQWRFTVSGEPYGSPVIAEQKVFAMSSGAVYAIDLETGKELWHREDISGFASVAYESGFVYVHNLLPATVYKLKASDGSTVWGPTGTWDPDLSTGISSPIVAGGKVIVGHESGLAEQLSRPSRGGIDILDAASGRLEYSYFTVPELTTNSENGASVWSSVSIDVAGGLVFATTGNNFTVAGPNSDAIHAFDLATGSKRWVKQVRSGDLSEQFTFDEQQDTDFGANPILAEVAGRRVVAAGDKASAFWALDRQTGQLLWSRKDLSGSHSWIAGGVMMNGAFDGRYFYVVSNEDVKVGGATLHKLDPQNDGVSVWMRRLDDTTWGALSLANGLLLVPNNTQLYVLDADSGATLNRFETGGTIAAGAAAIAQGKIVVKSGFLSILAPTTKSNNQIICYGLPRAAKSGNAAAAGGGPPAAGAGGAAGTATKPVSATFSAIYKDIFVGSGCTGGQCHSGPAAGGLNLRTRDVAYMSLVSVPAGTGAVGTATSECAASGLLRVAPGEPDASLLMLKLEHRQPCGAAMPAPTTMLPAPELERIRTWIAQGGMND